MNFFIFDGQSSADFGIYISGSGTYNAPERDIEVFSIPGRNGDLIVDNGRFKNIPVKYPCFITKEFPIKAERIRLWLNQNQGYRKLEDTYSNDFYRMAYIKNELKFTTRPLNTSAEFDIEFICKPQRFLKTGDSPILLTTTGAQIYNPYMPSAPKITIYGTGNGSITINQINVTITDISDYIVLDCDLQNAYKGTQNQNLNIKAPVFPVLNSGENIIGWSGGITSVEIIPRWWTV